MRTMPTRVILSHIVYGAKPCYEDKKVEDDEPEEFAKPTKKKAKRRKLK